MSQQKQYPRNQIYNNPSPTRPQFQQPKPNLPQTMSNSSGTSLDNLTYSPKSSAKGSTPEIAILHERIEYLQKELEMLTGLLMEEEMKKGVLERLEREKRDLEENLGKMEEINGMLEKQLEGSEKNNQELLNALKVVNDELETLKAEREQNISDSKNSKSKQQVQQDIIKLNDEISNVLLKLHTLNEDYELIREMNAKLEEQKLQMNAKISELEQRLSQELGVSQKYRQEYEYCKEEIVLLKEEIQQVNEMSIRKLKEVQDQYYMKENAIRQECQELSLKLKESQAKGKANEKKETEDQSTLLEIRNVKIRSLEIDNEMLKRELDSRDQQLSLINNSTRGMQRELEDRDSNLTQVHESYKQKIRNLQRSYDNRIVLLEQHIKDLKYIESKVSNLEQQTRSHQSQLRQREQKIYSLESSLQQTRSQSYYISSLEEEIRQLKGKEQAKDTEIQAVQLKRMELADELDDVKRKLERLQAEVRTTNQVKEKYGSELTGLKTRMKQLIQLSQQQDRHIREIQSQHQSNSRKKLEQLSILETTQVHDLEYTNKELQKMLINEKVQKENQNKRYKELLEDYKQLNHELTVELGLYRDAKSLGHPHCPIPSEDGSRASRSSKDRSVSGHGHGEREAVRKQLQIEKNKYQELLAKYEKTLQRYKGIQSKLSQLQKGQKQTHFLKIDNSSLRAQVTQLNIRIEQYKAGIQTMKKEAENRGQDAEKLRYSIQREYEGKMEVQRMEIINQYNVLLRNRGVRVQPTEFRRSPSSPKLDHTFHSTSQQIPYFPSPPQPFHPFQSSSSPSPLADTLKIRYHPEYKKLQQQYLKIHRQLLELEQAYNKSITQYRDEVQKLRIENQYHRKTIDELHAQGYGFGGYGEGRDSRDSRDGERDRGQGRLLEEWRNKYEEINRSYQKLYQEYVAYRSKNGHASDAYLNGANGQRLRELLRSPISSEFGHRSTKSEQEDLGWLKKLIDSKLVQLEITPREPASVVERAGWVIEKLSSLVLQLRQDRETLKNQKREVQKQNDKLKVKIETLEYENGHNLKQLAIALQKYKYLELKHRKLSQGPAIARQLDFELPKTFPEVPSINLDRHKEYKEYKEGSNQKDIHKHEAGLVREQRLALLRKYQREMENLGDQP